MSAADAGNLAAAIPVAPPSPARAGWRAELDLNCELLNGRTLLTHKRQLGPLTLQRPFYPEDALCHLYLLHPPGGLVGGDSLSVKLAVGAGAHALATTPGATKCYRSAGGDAVQEQRLTVATGASLEWFPQETILFPGARVRSRTEIALQADAVLIGWEMLCLGRPVIGERFDHGALQFGLHLSRDGRPLLADLLRVTKRRQLDGASGLRGWPATGTFIASGCDDTLLQVARQVPVMSDRLLLGISLLDDVLVARCLAATIEPMQRVFCALWTALRPALLGRDACPPRIWST
jgi:urease accessory protein